MAKKQKDKSSENNKAEKVRGGVGMGSLLNSSCMFHC